MLIIKICTMLYAQVILHEIGHMLVARGGDIAIKRICIGHPQISATIGIFSISPIPIGGYVEVVEADLNRKSRAFVIAFFEGGALLNILSSMTCFLCGRSTLLLAFIFFGVIFALISNMFFIPGTDAYDCCAFLKNKKNI